MTFMPCCRVLQYASSCLFLWAACATCTGAPGAQWSGMSFCDEGHTKWPLVRLGAPKLTPTCCKLRVGTVTIAYLKFLAFKSHRATSCHSNQPSAMLLVPLNSCCSL